jgi:UrcA family protein
MKTISYSKNIALVAAASVFVSAFAIGAHADEVTAPARTVRYSDLNLNTQAGAESLYHRIRNAAELVCGDVSSRQMAEAAMAKTCVDRAVAGSVRAVNSRLLTKVYDEHVGVAQTAISVASLR